MLASVGFPEVEFIPHPSIPSLRHLSGKEDEVTCETSHPIGNIDDVAIAFARSNAILNCGTNIPGARSVTTRRTVTSPDIWLRWRPESALVLPVLFSFKRTLHGYRVVSIDAGVARRARYHSANHEDGFMVFLAGWAVSSPAFRRVLQVRPHNDEVSCLHAQRLPAEVLLRYKNQSAWSRNGWNGEEVFVRRKPTGEYFRLHDNTKFARGFYNEGDDDRMTLMLRDPGRLRMQPLARGLSRPPTSATSSSARMLRGRACTEGTADTGGVRSR